MDTSCRYIFVDEETGNDSIVNEVEQPIGLSTNFETILTFYASPLTLTNIPGIGPPKVSTKSHLYAVIIIGVLNLPPCASPNYAFWNDISALYTTLIKDYGYKKENIFVHWFEGPYTDPSNIWRNDLDHDDQPDIQYAAYKDNIAHTFNCLSGIEYDPGIPKLNPDDQLFVYVGDHGDLEGTTTALILPYPDPNFPCKTDTLQDRSFANYVQYINCGQMIFLFQQCHSEGFKNYLSDYTHYPPSCKNRTIHYACKINETANYEKWITNGKFSEFSYYWIASIRGCFPYIDQYGPQPWRRGDTVCCPFPYLSIFTSCTSHPSYNPDKNGDGVVTMNEAFAFADDYDSYSGYNSSNNFYCDWYQCPPPSQPCAIESPGTFMDISFKEDLQSLRGLTGTISQSASVDSRSYVVGGPLDIDNDNLSLSSGTNIYFINELAKLRVHPGSTLYPGANTLFAGTENNYVYILNGGLGSLDHVTLRNDRLYPNNTFGGLYLQNSLSTGMAYVTVTNSGFVKFDQNDLTVDHSNFSNSYFDSQAGSVSVTNSIFDQTGIWIWDKFGGKTADIENNILKSNSSLYPCDLINVTSFQAFTIKNCTIHSGQYNGIGLYSCGHGTFGNALIQGNLIYDNNYGINIYLSNVQVYNNRIYDNVNDGVECLDASNPHLMTDLNIGSYTQAIHDNQRYQLYTDENSIPILHYNLIYREGDTDPHDKILYYDVKKCDKDQFNVGSNCWGDNTIPDQFYPDPDCFNFYPIWCDPDLPNYNPDEEMLIAADSLFKLGNYEAAKSLYLSLVDLYPHTRYAQSALEELCDVEQYVDNDYYGLQQYYLNNDSITADTALQRIGEFLANRCDVLLQNWSQAIAWYENHILNPPSEVDSICAIIDLENIYLLMEQDSTKSTYIGKLPQYKPSSVRRFLQYRDSLIRLLPFDHKKKPSTYPLAGLRANSLMQNGPNPFSTSTDIWYKLGLSTSQATLTVSNYAGQICKTIVLSDLSEGTHKINFDASSLSEGVYLYSLEVNGRKTDTKKMVVLR